MGCSGLMCFRWLCCVFLVTINILSMIIGALLIVLGALLLWGYSVVQSVAGSILVTAAQAFKEAYGIEIDFQGYFTSLANITGSAAGLLIGFGILLIIISCIGCFGACCGNPVCLIIYKVCVALLLIGQLIVVIIWFANSHILKQSVRNTLNTQVDKFGGASSINFESVTLNLLQILVGCCGSTNGSDFDRNPNWNRNYTYNENNKSRTITLKYPLSCCKYDLNSFNISDPYCPVNGTTQTSNYHLGCYDRIFELVDKNFRIDNCFYVLAGLLGLELLLIIGAVLIYCAKRQQKQDQKPENYKMHQIA